MEGLDQEIALLRVNLKAVIAKTPQNHDLQLRIIRTLARALVVRYQLKPEEKKNLTQALKGVIKDIGLPLGLHALLGVD